MARWKTGQNRDVLRGSRSSRRGRVHVSDAPREPLPAERERHGRAGGRGDARGPGRGAHRACAVSAEGSGKREGASALGGSAGASSCSWGEPSSRRGVVHLCEASREPLPAERERCGRAGGRGDARGPDRSARGRGRRAGRPCHARRAGGRARGRACLRAGGARGARGRALRRLLAAEARDQRQRHLGQWPDQAVRDRADRAPRAAGEVEQRSEHGHGGTRAAQRRR